MTWYEKKRPRPYRYNLPPAGHPLSDLLLECWGLPYMAYAGGYPYEKGHAFPEPQLNKRKRLGFDAVGFVQCALRWAGADLPPYRMEWDELVHWLEVLTPSDTLQPFDIVAYTKPRIGLVLWPAPVPQDSTVLLASGVYASNPTEYDDRDSYVRVVPVTHYSGWVLCRYMSELPVLEKLLREWKERGGADFPVSTPSGLRQPTS